MLLRGVVFIAVAVGSTVAVASPAGAAQRWAAADASGGEMTCTALSPCTLSNAVNGSLTGDTIIVKPGTYSLSNALTIVKDIVIRGEDAANPPMLVGGSGLNVPVVTADAALELTNLSIAAQGSNGSDALVLKGAARGDRLVLTSVSGAAAELVSSPGKTVLTNTVAVTTAGAGAAAVKLSDNGPVEEGFNELRNVTADAAAAGAKGVLCATTVATSTLVNAVVRGTAADVDASAPGSKCSATSSNLRTALSPGLVTTNVSGDDPGLDADYRPAAGSSVVDAGVDDAANGDLDLAGNPRVRGLRTDAGAYELQADAPTPPDDTGTQDKPGNNGTTGSTKTPGTPDTTPKDPGPAQTTPPETPLAPASPPQLGETILLDQAGNGTVLVKLPGSNRWIPLRDAATLPVGTTIDSRNGTVTLSSALPGGKAQTGTFSGGLFEVRQSKTAKGMTDILLRGAFARKCARKAKAKARSAAKKRRKASVRRLWAKDKGGRFRTHGKNSVATVRGTKWLTEDRCDGTYTKVVEGAVDVRERRTGKVRRVKAGRSILVRG